MNLRLADFLWLAKENGEPQFAEADISKCVPQLMRLLIVYSFSQGENEEVSAFPSSSRSILILNCQQIDSAVPFAKFMDPFP